ncbi:MAG: hypothetical protein M3492_03000, partial [Actinomycetota bacterium]|nr:hypothetical protein [Actinomycetota bacterium]
SRTVRECDSPASIKAIIDVEGRCEESFLVRSAAPGVPRKGFGALPHVDVRLRGRNRDHQRLVTVQRRILVAWFGTGYGFGRI